MAHLTLLQVPLLLPADEALRVHQPPIAQATARRHQLRLSRLSVLQRLLRLGAAARGLLLLHYC